MPPPLGRTPTRKMPKIEVYGLADSPPTRAAVRFFRERRIVVTFVDLDRKPLAPAELRRLLDRLGAAALLDREGRDEADGGSARPASDAAMVARIRADPRLLRLPLVRHGDEVTAGRAEATWKAWLAHRR